METMANLEAVGKLAVELKSLQEESSQLEGQLKDVKKNKERVSREIIAAMGMTEEAEDGKIETRGVIIDGVGTVKLDIKPHPRVMDIEAFLSWARSVDQQTPPLTINATTLAAWVAEQFRLNLPLPDKDILPIFWKTTARVNKA